MISPHSLRYELYPATQMLADQYLRHSQPAPASGKHFVFSKTVDFMPGLIARHSYYRRTSAYLAQKGIRFVPVRGLTRNVLSWDEAFKAISDTIKKVEDETGEAPDLLVHSKGGTDSLRVLAEHNEIGRAVFVASPMRGKSFEALVSLFSLSGKSLPCTEVLNDQTICAKIRTIASRLDDIVRVDEARIDGARNIVVRGTKNDRQWESHTGLPYFARNHIVRCIQDSSS